MSVIWSERRKPVIDLAAAFITDCIQRRWYAGMPISVMVPIVKPAQYQCDDKRLVDERRD